MAVMKTPGVYIVEKNAFPNSVVQVATAVPAFVGYTEMARNGNTPLHLTPFRITSLSDFHSYFGGPAAPVFDLEKHDPAAAVPKILGPDGAGMSDPLPAARVQVPMPGGSGSETWMLQQVGPAYALYGAIRAFFQNGGSACYIVSCGSYGGLEVADQPAIEAQPMLDGLQRLVKEPEPTMVVIPETTRLSRQDAIKVQQAMLMHCGGTMKNRFAILDLFGGHHDRRSEAGDPVATFRNEIGTNFLDFAAAYYPWVATSIYGPRDFSFANFTPPARTRLIKLLRRSLGRPPAEVATEIDRIGAPRLSGDFKLQVAPGGQAPLTPADISATDAGSAAEALTYALVGRAADMRGRLAMADTPGTAIESFTQADLGAGKVVYVHTADDMTAGKVVLTVTDADGIATDRREIDVEVRRATQDVATTEPGQAVTIEVLANDQSGADSASVTLVDADDGSDGKKLSVPDVGVWSVTDAGAITFAPVSGFAGPQASVAYTVTGSDGTVSAPTPVRVLVGDQLAGPAEFDGPSDEAIDKTLRILAPLYNDVTAAIAARMNALPPAAAMAGIYTMVDNSRGVWKAPANVSLNAVVAPMVNIDHAEQEDLNVTPQGKSINAIRPFVGEGTVVWGARTLDGNSLDWRYVNVRRTMIMIEESIRLASKAYVFEPNTANTWVTMRSMIENFLTSVWKQGGLAGTTPADAFSVHVGLGDTMTPVDILEGILRISVFVAVTRPAEFIEITFQQQMQKS